MKTRGREEGRDMREGGARGGSKVREEGGMERREMREGRREEAEEGG